ncbi:MAG TPA: hypothetical protein VFA90_17260 [Terriglobales bacterium]|nr:hypothetical protein [Terriglobales bacterium]
MPVEIEQEQHNVGRIIFNQQNFEFFCHNPNTGPVDWYVCGKCGRMIAQGTLEVVGQNRNFKRLV